MEVNNAKLEMVKFVLRIGLGYNFIVIMKLLDLVNVCLHVKNSLHTFRLYEYLSNLT